jgi:glycosyltransferase involved in cell wall biosynthesis
MATDSTRVDLLYHGLDLSRFPKPPESRSDTGVFRLVSVGRLVEKKGFDRLIDALALLPPDLKWHWTHIGGGALKRQMSDRAQSLGIDAQITWKGACDQPEVIAAMRDSDLFVLPSRVAEDGDRDGLPNVLMEAASQKLPILSTPISAIPEFITTGVHGLLVQDAPKDLASAIVLLAGDVTGRARMADAAYARLIADFGHDTGVARLSLRLKSLLGAV